MSDLAVHTVGLGKRYRSVDALVDCDITIPRGRVSGLVGANGAGKTTLIRLLAGMARPTSGTATVADRQPADDSAFLREIGYLAQQVPLYGNWTVDDHLTFGARMNPRWDDALARDRITTLRIPLDRRVDALSGGMRAQVALALALGKRPQLLLLDEPLASLDPLARREFMGSLAAAVAEGGLTVVLSSHLLGDLERICDHVVVMSEGRAVLCADIDEVLASHKRLTGTGSLRAIERDSVVIDASRAGREVSVVARLGGPVHDPAWRVEDVDLEEIVLAYLGLAEHRETSMQIVEAAR